MKAIDCLVLAALVAASGVSARTPAAGGEKGGALAEGQKTGYMLGRDVGKSLGGIIEEFGAGIDTAAMFTAIREAVAGAPSRLTDSATAAIDAQFRVDLHERRRERRKKAEDGNLAASAAFLAENRAVPGVVETGSGLQYMVIREGAGATPGPKDRVRVHYHGTTIDGKVFDSSVDRGEPLTFPVDAVIRGWTEALQLMKVGGKYRIFVPSDLAYGQRGAREPIGPNMALIFEIELLEIEKAADAADADEAEEEEAEPEQASAQDAVEFTDPRDGQVYRAVKIGGKTWMARNLNYKAKKSHCYGGDTANCEKYGRLYDWSAAAKACPAGWRLPGGKDWADLAEAAGGQGQRAEKSSGGHYWNTAGGRLKSESGWDDYDLENNYDGNGTDEYGFSALPGGFRGADGGFNGVGRTGVWWSAAKRGWGAAYSHGMDSAFESVHADVAKKSAALSVRCVQND